MRSIGGNCATHLWVVKDVVKARSILAKLGAVARRGGHRGVRVLRATPARRCDARERTIGVVGSLGAVWPAGGLSCSYKDLELAFEKNGVVGKDLCARRRRDGSGEVWPPARIVFETNKTRWSALDKIDVDIELGGCLCMG
jgi:hypothetical protein